MGKAKPAWVKTDIPKDIKIKYHWRAFIGNVTYSDWQKRLTKLDDGTREYNNYVSEKVSPDSGTYSRDTFKALLSELKSMPEYVIDSLPAELQSYVRDLRGMPQKPAPVADAPAAQAPVQVTAASVPAFTGDPTARGAHFESLRSLAESWHKWITRPMLPENQPFAQWKAFTRYFRYDRESGRVANFRLPIEDATDYPLFPCLEQHLSRTPLPDSYKQWKKLSQQRLELALEWGHKLELDSNEKKLAALTPATDIPESAIILPDTPDSEIESSGAPKPVFSGWLHGPF